MMGSCAAAAAAPQSFLVPKFLFLQQPDKFLISGNWNSSTVNCNANGNASAITKRKKRKNLRLFVKAEAYKRIPMDTLGAYQLVDDETGDKFIVWGGCDDHSLSSLPSQQVLSWNPKSQQSKSEQQAQAQAQAEVARTGAGDGVTAAAPVPERNFARLKAPKVKALIQKKSKSSNNNNKNTLMMPTTSSSSKQQMVPDSFRVKKDFNKKIRGKKATNSLQHHDVDDVTAPEYEHVPAPKARAISASASASTLRGWSGTSSASASGYSNASASGYSNAAAIAHPKLRRKMMTDSGFFSRKSFKDLGCIDDMIETLRSLSIVRPSHIQAMAYAPVLRGNSCIIADQSGSGKTLAYLVPIIQRLRQEELQGLGKSSPKSARVVILVPTAELASQVLNNCRSISKHGVPFRSMVVTGGFRQKTQLDNLQQELDVLIATPGRFIFLLQEGFVQLTNLKCVVLDEVDILFGDEGFEQVLQSLINSAPMEAQYLFVTATLPVDIYNKLVQVFPDCKVTMGPGIHRTSSKLEEVLVDCSGDGMEKNPETAFLNKKSALLQLAEESPVQKTIVFCNKIETCRKVENALKRFDKKELHIKVLPFHAALAQDVRLANMKEFLYSKSKDSMFLICTDRASRGIDFQNVDHVVLFDFPRDPSEYVRRVGRTARGAGSEGKAFVFVVGKQVSLARRIMDRNKKGHPLHDVPSAYELESSVL